MSQVYGRSPLCITITPRCRYLQDGITDILLKKIPVLWDAALYHWGNEVDDSEDSSVFIFRVTKSKKGSFVCS
jgi:hypothetical protein